MGTEQLLRERNQLVQDLLVKLKHAENEAETFAEKKKSLTEEVSLSCFCFLHFVRYVNQPSFSKNKEKTMSASKK